MRVYDFECTECQAVSENFITGKVFDIGICPDCKGKTKRIVSMRQTSPVDGSWFQEVTQIVDKNPAKAHCQEFIKHPTRANYNTWKKKENLRHRDPAESNFPVIDKKARSERRDKLMLKKYREREAVAI